MTKRQRELKRGLEARARSLVDDGLITQAAFPAAEIEAATEMNSSAVRNFGKYLAGHDGRVRHRVPDGGATALG